ncbi:MAG: YjbF family lipoprotein [Tabrizicola sp.]
MTVSIRLVAVVAALAVLAACGNDKGAANPVVAAVGQMAKATLANGKKGAAPAGQAAAPVGREELAAVGQPILRIRSKALGQDAFLTVVDTKENVVTWTAQGQANFSLRDGVLIQTRGLVSDLMSAEAPALAQLANGESYQRVYYFLGPDDAGTRRTYDCTAATVGRETIEVVGKSHDVIHVTETCTRPNGKVTNDFWIEGNMIRKSRQWASNVVSYLEFEKVID